MQSLCSQHGVYDGGHGVGKPNCRCDDRDECAWVVLPGSIQSHRAPLPGEAAAESSGHVNCWYWQALQVSHSLQASHMAPRLAPEARIEFSAEPGRLQMLPRQRLQMLPSEPGLAPEADIRPLLEIDITGLTRLQAERAAALGMQVPSGPLQ